MNRIIRPIITISGAAALTCLALGTGSLPASASGRADNCGSDGWVRCLSYAGYTTAAGNTNARVETINARWIEPRIVPQGYRDTYATFFAGYADQNGIGQPFEPGMPQIGTEADSIGGTPRYYAWYSPSSHDNDGPGYRGDFRNAVRPGDHMYASDMVRLSTSGAQHFTLTLTDVRYREHRPPLRWSHTEHATIAADSIASVTVGVSRPNQRLLSNFGTMRFTSVKVSGAAIGSLEPDLSRVSWGDSYGNLLAKTSALGGTGDSFTITWKHGR